jgi:hypothetical protein
MKYIVVKINDLETPILFSKLKGHDDIANKLGLPVISAGFVGTDFKPYGKSISLGKSSRPEDERLFKFMFIEN